ncbi:MAG: potassium-transporting ATPase subunit KdpC [Chloroflexota bacterium]|nr:potassium-transporting ATPase subunit KdpC [Chloroflexota bacterium]
MKTILTALRMLVVLTILTGVIYPLFVTLAAQAVFPAQANGSLVNRDGAVIGSSLIGQDMNGDPRYFWSRPSSISYNPLPSSGSNLGPTSAALAETVAARADAFRVTNGLPEGVFVPTDVLFASGSGLDPHISPEAARLQVARVAAARGRTVEQINALVDGAIEAPQLGFLGQPRVNVLLLNLTLDGLQ